MEAIKKNFVPLIVFVAAIWIVEAMNFFLGHGLTAWGILPRQASGLTGIPLAPFLHGGLWHAASNTLPLLFLVWLFARSALHVGASGLVFGYFGALLARAYFERSLLSIAIACATMVLYGGMLWGILPLRGYISFEGHLFGLVAGIVMAWLSHRYQPPHPKGH
jgi:membrane associated rhomboid family serine protease